MTRRSFINSSPEVVEGVLRTIVDSMAFIAQPENKPAVLKSLAKGLRLPKLEQAVEGYESLPMLYDKRHLSAAGRHPQRYQVAWGNQRKDSPIRSGRYRRRTIREKA
jgi:ABC-type nitrate/sulfonate/bicarbonate transport system substrate-binding protein